MISTLAIIHAARRVSKDEPAAAKTVTVEVRRRRRRAAAAKATQVQSDSAREKADE